MKKIINFLHKTIKVEGYEELTVPMFALCTMLSVLLFPCYAMAYGISHLLKIKDYGDMENFSEWFAPIISLLNGNAIIK